MNIRDRVIDFRRVPASQIRPSPSNWRTHPKEQADALRGLLAELGFAGAVLVRELLDGSLEAIDGHLRLETMGDRPVPVLVTDLDESEAKKLLATFDPLGAMAGADTEKLDALLREVHTDNDAVAALLASTAAGAGFDWGALDTPEPGTGGDEFDPTPEPDGPTRTQTADLWVIGGKHRLFVGDCTVPGNVSRLFGDATPDCVLTDPPYCSGGFQEAGRSVGSIGTDAKIVREIANDRLSTRGYMALIKSAIGATAIPLAYVFTDWRMWVNLFDVMESSGFGVRNMIVWDKGSPGMGVGWRTQHELVMFASRATVKFDNHKAQGNVISASRTGNPDHPTQKPLELLAAILKVTDVAQSVYDPFLGSGGTLVAAHRLGRMCYGCEIDPHYADVVLRRAEAEGLSCEKLK
jgi:DNA modification methylase